MKAFILLEEIRAAFQNEPHPSDLDIVTNNTPDYDLESLQIRDTFKVHTWQSLPDELMQYEQGGYVFMTKKGFNYYLPAYLCFTVRDYSGADSIPDNLIVSMTLPAEIDVIISMFNTKRYQMNEYLPKIDWDETHQRQLRDMNQSVHGFIDRYGQFNAAQGRAIYHFLVFMRDEYGKDFFNNEPQVAIERYWFQFA